MAAFEPVGTGLTVYTGEPVEGPVRWLDSPQAVIDFVKGSDVADSIAIVRGGTTTFLTPALNVGVKGIITLQGAPESHLGILAREYGIPCIMGVAFEQGVRTSRGETIPADGVIVRLDISQAPNGTVLAEEGAPVDDGTGPEPAAGMDPETAAELGRLLEAYRGEVPHAEEGDRQIRAQMSTEVLLLDDAAALRRDLTNEEVNELQYYSGWNMWDSLAARATEGESGLIPRQEYEAVGFVQAWNRYPELMRVITDAVGVDGLVEIGATARREVATKVNLLHIFGLGLAPAFGRGISIGLGQIAATDRTEDLREAMQFMRRLYKGVWGGGAMLTSMRGYEARVLEDAWIERFADEATPLKDAGARHDFQLFSADTELLGFLLHFDNRLGLADSGPYPVAGGRFMIVRDHFLSDDVYNWFDVAEELPHCITQAMIFEPTEDLRTQVFDISTLFTQPSNYLRHLVAAGTYARDRWDTPIEQLRAIDASERSQISERARAASDRLYRRIAMMSRREKVMAGAKVYYTEYILPVARRSGCWEQLRTEYDFHEIHPLTSEAYYPLVTGGKAATLVPQLFLTGAGFPPLEAASGDGVGAIDDRDLEELLPSLHFLKLKGIAETIPGPAAPLETSELILRTAGGLMLTESGHTKHAALIEAERRRIDVGKLRAVYGRFLEINQRLKYTSSQWTAADEDQRAELAREFEDIVERVEPVLRRSAELLPRFAAYYPRLAEAWKQLEGGDHRYAVDPRVDSIHTVWMEIHEDYLQTLGISREEEGSY